MGGQNRLDQVAIFTRKDAKRGKLSRRRRRPGPESKKGRNERTICDRQNTGESKEGVLFNLCGDRWGKKGVSELGVLEEEPHSGTSHAVREKKGDHSGEAEIPAPEAWRRS